MLLAGVSTIAGILGIGNRIGRALRLERPWKTVVGSIAALEILTLAVEAVSMAQMATRGMLIAVWALFCLCGAAKLRVRKSDDLNRYTAVPASILILNLLIAVCPSTKGDEVYYHMIVPGRIVQDGGLSFYREPMRAAIYPQMAFQIGFAPFHALALPDAGNVVSWFFGALLVWFTYTLIETRTGSRVWAAVFSTAIAAGLYTTVWHTTSGAHAIGDLAATAAVISIYTGPNPIAIGILVAAFASTKVFFFPLALAIVSIAAVRLRWKSIALVAVVPIVFMLPLMIWTAVHSGSPFGPLFEGIAGPSPYFPNEVRAFIDNYVAGQRGPIPDKLRNEAVNFSPILWISIAALIFLRRHIAVKPAIGFALLVLQVVIILGWNTYDARYLGGVHYALMILLAAFLSADLRQRMMSHRRFLPIATMLIAPWMLLQIVYAVQFLKLPFGLESKADFYRRYVPFERDFVQLDRLLPQNALLLAVPYALDSIYAPRAIYYHVLDVPPDKPAYLLTYVPNGSNRENAAIDLHSRFTPDRLLYENADAVVATYRTPGRKPLRGVLRVTRLR